jgi:hypothetical protein
MPGLLKACAGEKEIFLFNIILHKFDDKSMNKKDKNNCCAV